MTLTRNEIRKRLSLFSKEQQGKTNERSQAQTFWLRFYECFGIRAESATIYEQSVKKLSGAQGFIDSFIPGKLIVEHKSAGKDLDAAFDQASEYFLSLQEAERPRYIITSDFARIRLYDLQSGGDFLQCKLAELSKKADWFMFLVEGEITDIVEESEADRKAAYAIGALHEALLQANFKGRDLEVFLTRLLFCLFADDTGIFGENNMFRRLMEATRADGGDVGRVLAELFQVLDTSDSERQKNLDEALARFAYINGKLFADPARIPSFDSGLRAQLIACAQLDWSNISPAIFGAMFQGVLEESNPSPQPSPAGGRGRSVAEGEGETHKSTATRKASRRELGAHYTSERNILRVINPLCMDDLRNELNKAAIKDLAAFYDKLATLTFFDPACGCGNFLVIAFRELRQLEMDTIDRMNDARLTKAGKNGLLDVSTLCRVRVSQFYGIEIDESAAHIARVAMWITDHQLNLEAAARFGTTRPSVPLIDSATIVCGNALRLNWREVLLPEQCSYVLGNPPFAGYSYQSAEQKSDMAQVFGKLKGAGVLDYVTCWYAKAAEYIANAPDEIQVAFVSTNSITQGEQVAILWSYLFSQGIHINFAHRTFQWSNEGKGIAAVHCVIVGFGLNAATQRKIFDYGDGIKGEPTAITAHNINPYLVDAPTVFIDKRRTPICAAPEMANGGKPTEGGNLLMNDADKAALLLAEPQAEKWIRPYLMGDEFINNISRWCLWLKGIAPAELRAMPHVMRRVEAVKAMRLASTKAATVELANTPTLFGEIRQPSSARYLAIPKVSSERRNFIPIGYLDAEVVCGDKIFFVSDANLYTFGMLNSTLHNAWMRTTCGRLKSDYSYSNTIVYNNYPWCEPTDKHRAAIEAAAQGILDARALYPESSLADLYDPTAMPPELTKAHTALDKAVDAAYQYKGGKDDAARVAFLFERYQQLTSLLPALTAKKPRKAKS
jgi:type I restriction-modification system DNA methylase subunit